jgi:hypothetical protein
VNSDTQEKPYSAWPVVWETISEPRLNPWKDCKGNGEDQFDSDWMYEEVRLDWMYEDGDWMYEEVSW